MAKLKAHGTELLRVERYETKWVSVLASDYQTRYVRVYMSDGAILTKFYCRIGPQREWRDYGWKRVGRFASAGVVQTALIAEIKRDRQANGWKVIE